MDRSEEDRSTHQRAREALLEYLRSASERLEHDCDGWFCVSMHAVCQGARLGIRAAYEATGWSVEQGLLGFVSGGHFRKTSYWLLKEGKTDEPE